MRYSAACATEDLGLRRRKNWGNNINTSGNNINTDVRHCSITVPLPTDARPYPRNRTNITVVPS